MIALLIRDAATSAGDTLGRKRDVVLSREGKAQAARLAAWVRACEIEVVFSSPLPRAVQTARIVAAGGNRPLITDAALGDMDVGDWDNRLISEVACLESWKSFNTFPSGTRCPGGEMMIEVQARAVAFLERKFLEYTGGTVAVVSHAGVIRGAMCHYLGVPLDLSSRVHIRPASVSTLRLFDGGAEILGLNETGEWTDHSPD
jgi:broad specificity phosphatase PhoE